MHTKYLECTRYYVVHKYLYNTRVSATRLTLDRQTNPGQIETTMAQSSLSNTFTHSKLITHINNDPT